MTLEILGAGKFLAAELNDFPLPPGWRKATRNMIMATESIQRAVANGPEIALAGNPRIGFVLGSSSGELETSAEFMTTWSKSRMARPLLFQNSLHNATTGFASIHFQLTGPSFTVSALGNTPEECVQMVRSLLAEDMCDACLVTLVEGHKTLAGWLGEEGVTEGACTLFLTDAINRERLGLSARGRLEDSPLQLNYTAGGKHLALVAIDESGFYRQARRWERAP